MELTAGGTLPAPRSPAVWGMGGRRPGLFQFLKGFAKSPHWQPLQAFSAGPPSGAGPWRTGA